MEDKYIIVKTYCNKIEIADKIINKVLEERLASGSQLLEVYSKYWWNYTFENCKEYQIEFRTKLSKFKEIEKVIKEIHDYDVCEISYYVIDGNRDFLEWIDEYTK